MTVNVTVYVPAAAYVCDAVTPVPDAPSPKSHAYDATDTVRVHDPEPSTDTPSPDTADVNAAVGGCVHRRGDRHVWWTECRSPHRCP